MKIKGILETCLYADDLTLAEEFYSRFPGLKLITKEEDRHLFYRCGNSILIIFNPVHTSNIQTEVNGSQIPLHGTKGDGHIAFSIDSENLNDWKEFFRENSIDIESEVNWKSGTVSLYFRDPAGNSLELVSPYLWES